MLGLTRAAARPSRPRSVVIAAASMIALAGSPPLALADYHIPPPPPIPFGAGPGWLDAQRAAIQCNEQEMERHIRASLFAAGFEGGLAALGDPAKQQALQRRLDRLDAFAGDLRAWFKNVCARTVGDQTFYQGGNADKARPSFNKAEAAARDCNRQAYLDAIKELRAVADGLDKEANALIGVPGIDAARSRRASELQQDAKSARDLAGRLEREYNERFKHCPPEGSATPPLTTPGTIGPQMPGTGTQPPGTGTQPPGTAPPPGTTPAPPKDGQDKKTGMLDRGAPGTGYAFTFQPGGTVTWAPRVSGGTIIPQLGVPGTELPLVWSPQILTGGSFQIDAKIPLSITPLDREWTLIPRVLYGYADGSASGAIAPGGVFTGRTYLSPNPFTGNTGVFYGMTGQAIDIRSRAQRFGLDILVGTNLLGGQMHGWQYQVFAGGGLSYRFDWTSHTIDERNLSVAGIWSRTEFKTDDHFIGARLAAGVKVQQGPWHASLTGHVTPGVVVGSGSARQWNACAPCLPAEQSFMLEHERTRTAFGVHTGVGATVGYDLTRSVRLSAFVQYDFSSRQSNWQNPVTPQKGPPRLGADDATVIAFGVRVRVGIFLP